jgi:predicted nucleotidyltransferase
MSWYSDNLILNVMVGSHSYGLATPESDVDKKGIAFLPVEEFFNMGETPEQHIEEANKGYIEDGEPTDLTIYTVQKYFDLASTCNPNIIEMLFGSKDNLIFVNDIGQKLIDNRDVFLSKKARWSFVGYADSQLKRIKNHRAWLLNPPEKKPTREDYGLPPMPEISKDQRRAFLKLVSNILQRKRDYFDAYLEFQKIYEKIDWQQEMNELDTEDFKEVQTLMKIDDNMMEVLKKETRFERDLTHYGQYTYWKNHRNPKRAELEARSGYDTKHGSHLIRLMIQGKEILESGTLHTDRREVGDVDLLLDIKNGVYSYDDLIKISDGLRKDLDELYVNSNAVPQDTQHEAIRNLYAELIYDIYRIKI